MVYSIVTTSGATHIHSDVSRFVDFQIFNLQGRFDNDFDSYKTDLISCFVDRASLYNLSQIIPTRCTILLNIFNTFISFLYMFRASMCPSSGENYCIYATLVFVTLYGWHLVCWLEYLFISLLYTFRGIHVSIIRRRSLYLCDTGIFHSVWVASGLLQQNRRHPYRVTNTSVA